MQPKLRKFKDGMYIPFFDFDLRVPEDEKDILDSEIDAMAEFLEKNKVVFRDLLIFKWYKPYHRFYIHQACLGRVRYPFTRFNIKVKKGKKVEEKYCVGAEYLHQRFHIKKRELLLLKIGETKCWKLKHGSLIAERTVDGREDNERDRIETL